MGVGILPAMIAHIFALLLATTAAAHDSWISRGDHRNAAG
jgi:hypothetical protein